VVKEPKDKIKNEASRITEMMSSVHWDGIEIEKVLNFLENVLRLVVGWLRQTGIGKFDHQKCLRTW
jgi:hypothetical protein